MMSHAQRHFPLSLHEFSRENKIKMKSEKMKPFWFFFFFSSLLFGSVLVVAVSKWRKGGRGVFIKGGSVFCG